MALPNLVVKVVLAGTLQSGEIFNHGFWYKVGTTLTQSDMDSLASTISSLWSSDFLTTTVKGYYPGATVWTTVTCYYYASGGPAADLVSTAPITSGGGTGGTQVLPDQVALVATLQTGIPGRRTRGRTYLPAPHAGTLTAGQLSNSDVDGIAAALASFFSALNGIALGGLVHVVSRKFGSSQLVKSVKVDSRLDTQRRRANKEVVAHTAISALTVP